MTISDVRLEPVSYFAGGVQCYSVNVLYTRNGAPASARLSWVRSAAEAKRWLEAAQRAGAQA